MLLAQISLANFSARHLDVTCDVTLRKNSRSHYSCDKARQNKEIEQIPRWWEPRDLRVVWHCSPADCRTGVVAPDIEFNAHCYQRRKDATQLHCLAGLVAAGDIINRLRAPHRPSTTPFFAGLCCGPGESSRVASGCGVRDGNTIFCIGKHHRFLVTRDLVIAAYRARGKWNSRGALSSSEVSTAFIKRMNFHKEPLNLQGE